MLSYCVVHVAYLNKWLNRHLIYRSFERHWRSCCLIVMYLMQSHNWWSNLDMYKQSPSIAHHISTQVFLWVQTVTYILLQWLMQCSQYHVKLGRAIPASECIRQTRYVSFQTYCMITPLCVRQWDTLLCNYSTSQNNHICRGHIHSCSNNAIYYQWL